MPLSNAPHMRAKLAAATQAVTGGTADQPVSSQPFTSLPPSSQPPSSQSPSSQSESSQLPSSPSTRPSPASTEPSAVTRASPLASTASINIAPASTAGPSWTSWGHDVQVNPHFPSANPTPRRIAGPACNWQCIAFNDKKERKAAKAACKERGQVFYSKAERKAAAAWCRGGAKRPQDSEDESEVDEFKSFICVIVWIAAGIFKRNPLMLLPSAPVASFAGIVLMTATGAKAVRDHEVCHTLLNLPLVQTSRDVIDVDCRLPDNRKDLLHPGRSHLDKYLNRNMTLHRDVSFGDWLLNYEVPSQGPARRRVNGKARILNLMPSQTRQQDPEAYAMREMMLKHAFSDFASLKIVDGVPCSSWVEAGYRCEKRHLHLGLPSFDTSDAEYSEQQRYDVERDILDHLANAPKTLQQDCGERQIDTTYDWSKHRCAVRTPAVSFWSEAKMKDPVDLRYQYVSQGMADTLVKGQRKMYDIVLDHFRDNGIKGQSSQILLQLDGKAGTGKSHLIAVMSAHLAALADSHGQEDPVLRTAPTGVAAHAISGRTLHALLKIPVDESYRAMSQRETDEVKAQLRCCKYLIIDEKSMVSLKLLVQIDRRCRELAKDQHAPFSGISVLLCGDFGQLGPVGGQSLFFTGRPNDDSEKAGQELYKLFRRSIYLDTLTRQIGIDEEAIAFRKALNGLRQNDVTLDNWRILSSRVQASLSQEET
ncbi:putative DNA helicase Pif1, P-loop containing nucleoside triphosphate hydrolase [Septoria linicola]|nr:putative DNA helicase Pif1, P-loop containing nucleoside triphosphate hydrolase [Septoria linicola]